MIDFLKQGIGKEVICPKCKKTHSGQEALERNYICSECGKYMPIGAKARIYMNVDQGTFEPWFEDLEACDPLKTEGYPEKLASAQEKSGSSEAVTVGKGKIGGIDTVIGVCDPNFMIGSMGRVMGERITLAFEKAIEEKLPVILFCCSGGARMQEGIISLMQMEKTSAAVKKHSEAGLFYCSVLTDPTMGGVTASFASLGDVVLAEPKARVGFAGPRVIQQTIGHTLPEGFQTSEFMLEHGMVDEVVERAEQKAYLQFLLKIHSLSFGGDSKTVTRRAETTIDSSLFSSTKTPWERVKTCRSGMRAAADEYISEIFSDFHELHGDRCFGDDRALVGGIGFIGNVPVTVLADLRGKSLEERVKRNFGMPKPEGYRKAIRLMKQAEKFHRPVITFINTSGAFCGIDAEERGQGEAIAKSIMEMSFLKTPTLCILTGEGGSGGALATAVGNEVWMLENSTYAILSPEGYSAILWKTEGRAEEAAAILKLTSDDLKELGVIDRIIPEFSGAVTESDEVKKISDVMAKEIESFLKHYKNASPDAAANDRYERFRKF